MVDPAARGGHAAEQRGPFLVAADCPPPALGTKSLLRMSHLWQPGFSHSEDCWSQHTDDCTLRLLSLHAAFAACKLELACCSIDKHQYCWLCPSCTMIRAEQGLGW